MTSSSTLPLKFLNVTSVSLRFPLDEFEIGLAGALCRLRFLLRPGSSSLSTATMGLAIGATGIGAPGFVMYAIPSRCS